MKASRYRKKPVEIEAIRFDGNNSWLIEEWSNGKVLSSPVLESTPDNPIGAYLQILTLEGVMIGKVGDWIVRGVKGEFYSVKNDIFEATYEVVEPLGHDCVGCRPFPCLCERA